MTCRSCALLILTGFGISVLRDTEHSRAESPPLLLFSPLCADDVLEICDILSNFWLSSIMTRRFDELSLSLTKVKRIPD